MSEVEGTQNLMILQHNESQSTKKNKLACRCKFET